VAVGGVLDAFADIRAALAGMRGGSRERDGSPPALQRGACISPPSPVGRRRCDLPLPQQQQQQQQQQKRQHYLHLRQQQEHVDAQPRWPHDRQQDGSRCDRPEGRRRDSPTRQPAAAPQPLPLPSGGFSFGGDRQSGDDAARPGAFFASAGGAKPGFGGSGTTAAKGCAWRHPDGQPGETCHEVCHAAGDGHSWQVSGVPHRAAWQPMAAAVPPPADWHDHGPAAAHLQPPLRQPSQQHAVELQECRRMHLAEGGSHWQGRGCGEQPHERRCVRYADDNCRSPRAAGGPASATRRHEGAAGCSGERDKDCADMHVCMHLSRPKVSCRACA